MRVCSAFLIKTSPSDAGMIQSCTSNHLCGEKSPPCHLRTCTYILHVFRNFYREDIFYTCPSSNAFTSVDCNFWLCSPAAKNKIHPNSPCSFLSKDIFDINQSLIAFEQGRSEKNIPLYMKMIGNSNIFQNRQSIPARIFLIDALILMLKCVRST